MAEQLRLLYNGLHGRRNLRKRAPLVGGGHGFTSVPDGHELFTYSVYINDEELRALAQKAAGNKSGKSKVGPIRVEITDREKFAEPGARHGFKEAFKQ